MHTGRIPCFFDKQTIFISDIMSFDIRTNLRNNKTYFIFSSVMLIAGLAFLLIFGKEQSFLMLNAFHTQPLDVFVTYYTHLGDGYFSVFMVVLLYILQRRTLAIAVLLSFLLSGVLAQILKKNFSMPRPRVVFDASVYNNFIEGVTVTGHHSFPSGHTATAFALVFTMLLFMKSNWSKWGLVFLAFGVAYSRVYLGQHFLSDVIAGASIGMLCGYLSARWEGQISNKKAIVKQKPIFIN